MSHHLVGVAEVAAILGVSRQRVHQLIEAGDFPAPEAELSAGKVWSREAVDAWRAAHPERLVEDSQARPLLYDFSEAARRVIGRAQDESRRLGHSWLGTEHLLLGLLGGEAANVTSALAQVGISREGFEQRLLAEPLPAGRAAEGPVPFTPRAMSCLQKAISLAKSAGEAVAEPRHIALAAAADHASLAARLMAELAGSDQAKLEADLSGRLRAGAPDLVIRVAAEVSEPKGGPVRCSFCNKVHAQVAKVIAGPGVYICNECVGLCDEILAA